MPDVLIVPYNQLSDLCREAIHYANSCQSDFNFNIRSGVAPGFLNQDSVDIAEALPELMSIKKTIGYTPKDTMVVFFDGALTASDHGLKNLFVAAAGIGEECPGTAIISLQFLKWSILEAKFDYQVQRHALLHLIVGTLIGCYTKLGAHSDIGCLLDLNSDLRSFNRKLERGYYLCSNKEYDCYNKIRSEEYGDAILRLCDAFKRHDNYSRVINQFISGDKIEVGNISNNQGQIIIGKKIAISSDIDKRRELEAKLNEIAEQIRNEITSLTSQTNALIEAIGGIQSEMKSQKPEKNRIEKWVSVVQKSSQSLIYSNELREALQWISTWFVA